MNDTGNTGFEQAGRQVEHFQRQVLHKLGSLEAKMDMLVGNGQPGRVRLAEQRIAALEKNDVRRSVYDRILNATITVALSATIAMHEHWFKR